MDEVVRHVDLLPTILDLVSSSASPQTDGTSMAGLLTSDDGAGEKIESRPVFAESFPLSYQYGWSSLATWIDGERKWIRAPRPELYRLDEDPGESRNRAEEGAADLASRLAAVLEGATDDPPSVRRVPDSGERERLQALGYVTGVSPSSGDAAGASSGSWVDPKDAVGTLGRIDVAKELAEAGRLEEAESTVRSVLADNPGNSMAQATLGTILLAAGRPAEAARACEAALVGHHSLASARRNLARARFEGGDADAAEREYRRSLEVEPDSMDAMLGLAAVAESRGDRGETVRRLLSTSDLAPRDAAAHFRAGRWLARLGRTEDAIAAIERSLATPPAGPTPYLELGSLCLAAGRTDGAVRAFGDATAAFPESAAAWNALGTARVRSGDADGAVGDFERAVALNPSSGTPAVNLAGALVRAGRTGRAVEVLRELVERPDPPPAAMKSLGLLWLGSPATHSQGRRLLERYLRVAPGDRDVRQRLDRSR